MRDTLMLSILLCLLLHRTSEGEEKKTKTKQKTEAPTTYIERQEHISRKYLVSPKILFLNLWAAALLGAPLLLDWSQKRPREDAAQDNKLRHNLP